MNALYFFIGTLATYRAALLLSEDSGPFKLLSKLRSLLKREARHSPALRKSDIHKGIECLRCSSVWVAFPVALYGGFRESLPNWTVVTGDILLLALALSSVAILLNRIRPAA